MIVASDHRCVPHSATATVWRALALAALLAAGVGSALAQTLTAQEASERSVKAAYIYRFLGFVEWPAEAFATPQSPLVIGVVGGDDVATELEALAPGRTAQSRPLAVRRLTPGEPVSGVHVLYVGRGASARTAALARAVGERRVLIITDVEGGLELGSMINFVAADGRVRFEVAVDNAEKGALKLSSRLLAVASRVRTGG